MRLQGLFCAALLLGLPAALHANATGGPYDLRRAGFSSGAGHSSGGPYELYGSLFRPDAHSAATGGIYRLTGGLLIEAQSTSPLPTSIFRNGFE